MKAPRNPLYHLVLSGGILIWLVIHQSMTESLINIREKLGNLQYVIRMEDADSLQYFAGLISDMEGIDSVHVIEPDTFRQRYREKLEADLADTLRGSALTILEDTVFPGLIKIHPQPVPQLQVAESYHDLLGNFGPPSGGVLLEEGIRLRQLWLLSESFYGLLFLIGIYLIHFNQERRSDSWWEVYTQAGGDRDRRKRKFRRRIPVQVLLYGLLTAAGQTLYHFFYHGTPAVSMIPALPVMLCVLIESVIFYQSLREHRHA